MSVSYSMYIHDIMARNSSVAKCCQCGVEDELWYDFVHSLLALFPSYSSIAKPDAEYREENTLCAPNITEDASRPS